MTQRHPEKPRDPKTPREVQRHPEGPKDTQRDPEDLSRVMKCLSNRAESHLSGQVECELERVANGAWVNQGFCGTPPPLPRVVSTIYNPQPVFPHQGSVDSVCMPDPGPPHSFKEQPSSLDGRPVKKSRGCCSFVKGRMAP